MGATKPPQTLGGAGEVNQLLLTPHFTHLLSLSLSSIGSLRCHHLPDVVVDAADDLDIESLSLVSSELLSEECLVRAEA